MKIGTVETIPTGETNGHPAVIISGKIAAGTVCAANGLLKLDETTGEFTAHDLAPGSGAAYITLEPITCETAAAKVLLHGTFNGDMVIKADGGPLSLAERAAVQNRSQIFFI